MATEAFVALAEARAASLGLHEGLPIAACGHPIGGLAESELRARAGHLVAQILTRLDIADDNR